MNDKGLSLKIPVTGLLPMSGPKSEIKFQEYRRKNDASMSLKIPVTGLLPMPGPKSEIKFLVYLRKKTIRRK